jgi:hypothetical protein
MATGFSGGRSRSARREPSTIGKQLVSFITLCFDCLFHCTMWFHMGSPGFTWVHPRFLLLFFTVFCAMFLVLCANYKHNQVTDNRMIPYLNMIALAAIVTRESCLKSFKVESVTQWELSDTIITETTIIKWTTIKFVKRRFNFRFPMPDRSNSL